MTARLKKIGFTTAAGLGLFAGAAGIAAASANGIPAPAPAAVVEPADEATEAPDAEGTESEAVGDEADDGVDHQFEGEEVGENGNGIPDADDLNGTEADD